jgi:serine/threonine protein kinase/Tfp pilus assembly protein PilF
MNPRPGLLAPTDAYNGTPNAPAVALDDTRVIEAVEEYLAALETGARLDRMEFLARHLEIAEALARCLDGLEFVHGVAPQLSGTAPGSRALLAAGIHPESPLGDFRIVREVGRGGMGVVYEAVQLSLGRRVALKVLPFATALDAKQLARFKNEAQAAAQLQHQNIVPVYGVGSERGVHYYAMQFIDGHTLAAAIGQLLRQTGLAEGTDAASLRCPDGRRPNGECGGRAETRAAETTRLFSAALSTERSTRSPAFVRTVAALGVQTAEALEHAHQMGVVHRDIKPANLMVDGRGNLWVTDFGLAHFQSQPVLTMSSDVLGTLRYMSPEQARARPGPVDQRTDLYSLGATLYELLTLHPAIEGSERQELLARLADEEPIPPRRHNPSLPTDLETILLKALAKEPAERYSTAQEMADDLRRFLEDRPIQARRPTLAQRAVKWARRHRWLVVGVAVLLLGAVVALALSTALIWREKALKEKAYQAEAQQRREAEANALYARQAVDQMYLEAEEWMVHGGAQQERLQQFLRKALKFYQQFARDRSAEPEAQLAASRAYHRVGEIQDKLGQFDRSEKAYRQAIALLEGLEPGTREKPEYRFALVLEHEALFQLCAVRSRLRDAGKAIRRALVLADRLTNAFPRSTEYRVKRVECHLSLAELDCVAGRYPQAGQAFRRTLALLKQLRADFPRVSFHSLTASVNDSLGLWFWYMGKCEKAEQAYLRAKAALERLPAAPKQRLGLARILDKLGHFYQDTAQFPQAIQACQKAIALQEKLTREFPAVPRYRGDLASYYSNLGGAFRRAGRLDRAESTLRRAVALLEQLTADFPSAPDYRMQLAADQKNLANLYWATGRYKETERGLRRAIDLSSRLAKEIPDRPDYREQLGSAHRALGRFLTQPGRYKDAEQALRRALATFVQLAADFPDSGLAHQGLRHRKPASNLFPGRPVLPGAGTPGATDILAGLPADTSPTDYRAVVAACRHDLGVLLAITGRFPQAEQEYRQARDLLAKLAAGSARHPDYRYAWVGCCRNLAALMQGAHRLPEKEQVLRRALAASDKLLADLPEAPPRWRPLDDPLGRGQWAVILAELALTLRDQGKQADARRLLDQADRRLTLKAISPEPEVRRQLQIAYTELAHACVHLGKYREAAGMAVQLGRLSSDRWKELSAGFSILAWCIRQTERDDTLPPARRKARVAKYASQARALLDQALQRGKDDPACQHALAWMLINSPAPQMRDPKRALALARQAVAAAPHKAPHWAALGAAHWRLGNRKDAMTALEKSLTIQPKNNPDCQNALAWLLVVNPDPPAHDLKRALKLARQAVAAVPHKAQYWTTLGAAHYRAGEWKAAITAFYKTFQIEPKGNVLDGLFLAMTHCQRGAREEARQWFDSADRAMIKVPRSNEELWRLHAEAAALMGLPRPAKASRGRKSPEAKTSAPPRAP